MELPTGDLDFPTGVFAVDEAVVLHEALLAGGWIDVHHVTHEDLTIETVAKSGGSNDTSKLAITENGFAAEGPRVAVFVVVLENELQELLLNADFLLLEQSLFADKVFVEFDAVFTSAFVRRRPIEKTMEFRNSFMQSVICMGWDFNEA